MKKAIGEYELKTEDRCWLNSDKSYVNIVLKTKDWVGGDSPTQADKDAFDHFKITLDC